MTREFASLGLEDRAWDVIEKARLGLGLSNRELADRAGLPEWPAVSSGAEVTRELAVRVASVLGLGERSLWDLAERKYLPRPQELPVGLFCASTPFGDMLVNSYVVWDPSASEAALFDTGSDADPMLEFCERQSLRITQVFLTHVHGDHILDLDRVVERTGAVARVSGIEPLEGAETFVPGAVFPIGGLRVSTRRTSGHSVGGITYVVEGLSRCLAIVGDAMFAGSMGGAVVSYAEALRTNREEILSLPDETLLCPGHGPLTTVGEQKLHNPFFAV